MGTMWPWSRGTRETVAITFGRWAGSRPTAFFLPAACVMPRGWDGEVFGRRLMRGYAAWGAKNTTSTTVAAFPGALALARTLAAFSLAFWVQRVFLTNQTADQFPLHLVYFVWSKRVATDLGRQAPHILPATSVGLSVTGIAGQRAPPPPACCPPRGGRRPWQTRPSWR